MRRVRFVVGLAVAVCAFGALAASAIAKEKLVFGEFVASIAGTTITPSTPAAVVENKEDEAELSGLQIGQYKFGAVDKASGTVEYEEPCLKSPKVTGTVFNERSATLQTEVDFRECVSSDVANGIVGYKTNSFKLPILFQANESAELGTGIKITKNVVLKIKGAQTCVVEIPEQFVPAKAGQMEEKFYEAAEYTPESESPVENWQKIKIKEEYPGDFKDRLEIETTEKFKGIVSYVDTVGTEKKGCAPKKGEANSKLITEPGNEHYGWTEYTNGRIDMDVEGLEIKGGQLTFEPPA
jgi:hypothetical protein